MSGGQYTMRMSPKDPRMLEQRLSKSYTFFSCFRRQYSASRASASVMPATFDKINTTSSNTITTYEKTLTITHDHSRIDMRFFTNPFFCEKLRLYLLKTFITTCSFRLQQREVIIHLTGNKQGVKDGLDALKSLFVSTATRVYNTELTDQKGKALHMALCFH